MTTLEKMLQQREALDEIIQKLTLVEEIANISIKACKALKMDFFAGNNREICSLIEECDILAAAHEINFDFDYSMYDYIPQGYNYNWPVQEKPMSLIDKIVISKNTKPFGFVSNSVNHQWEGIPVPFLVQGQEQVEVQEGYN